MEHFYNKIEGWFNFQDIYTAAVNRFESGSHFVEIGSWLGCSTSYMAVEIINSGKDIKFDCIDPWNGSDGGNESLYSDDLKKLRDKNTTLYDEFTRNIELVKDYVNPIKSYSYECVNNYENNSIDFLFIDGSHEYEPVKRDLEEWYCKVKDNGIIAGHDFMFIDCPGVYNAVNDFFGKENVSTINTSWFVDNSIFRTKKRKIIDTFIFYNELELLMFRLKELNDYVDYFVLVESRKSHSGNDKELIFDKNKNLFKDYLHKIVHVIVDDLLDNETISGFKDVDEKSKYIMSKFKNNPARIREEHQRNSITIGLDRLNLKDDDIVIISDADEIINPEIILKYKDNNFDMLALEQEFYFYNLNYKYPKIWTFPKVVKYKMLKELTPEDIRLSTNGLRVPNSGWHFSYFFGSQNIVDKIKNFSHQEFNNDFYTNEDYIEKCIKEGKYIFSDVKLEYIEINDNKNLPKNYDIILNWHKYSEPKKLIKIIKTEIIVNENNTKDIKLYYEYFGENEIDIRINVIDTIFKTVEVFHVCKVVKNVNYWAILNPHIIHPRCNTHLSMGIDIIIRNNKNEEILLEEKVPFIITDLKKRSLNSQYSQSIPNYWVIGDSHIGNIFTTIDQKILYCNHYILNYISHFILSISRFIKSDWLSFLRTIPIRDKDKLIFFLGEIDLRNNIIWSTDHIKDIELRKNNLINNTNKLLIGYLNVLKEIQKIYSNCEIIVVSPNPPLRDTFTNKELICGTEEERLFLWNCFDSFFNQQEELIYWNCMKEYTDKDGYMKSDMLRSEGDHHIYNGELFINTLKIKLS
jgi:beta-1,4-mannosyl-glycoprotein beta-1,4-N-acetylglucosaminyltransferase